MRILRRALLWTIAVILAFSAGAGVAAITAEEASESQSGTLGRASPGPAAEDWPGIWPQKTRDAAALAQQCADRGDTSCTWQRSFAKFVRAYAAKVLHWPEFHSKEALRLPDPGSPGPYTIHLGRCPVAIYGEFPPRCPQQTIRLERLVRRDETGIWSVISAVDPRAAELAALRAAPDPVTPRAGQSYSAVYFAVGYESSSAVVTAVERLRALQLHPVVSDLACDRGAAEQLLGSSVASGKSGVALYFRTPGDASAFASAVTSVPRLGIVRISRTCSVS